MRFLKLSIAALVFSLGAVFSAHALDRQLTEEEVAIINDISAHHSAVEQMAGRFIQLDSSGNRAEGIFYIKRPEKKSALNMHRLHAKKWFLSVAAFTCWTAKKKQSLRTRNIVCLCASSCQIKSISFRPTSPMSRQPRK